jgi:hypothetical protein
MILIHAECQEGDFGGFVVLDSYDFCLFISILRRQGVRNVGLRVTTLWGPETAGS